LLIYALAGLAVLVDVVVLWKAGEFTALDDIIQRQKRGAIYNALSISFADYKYAAYTETRPQIVAIGTSRAMQIRATFFRPSFYNLGGLVQGPLQANAIANRLILRERPPKLVIFALDFWTFCRRPGERAGGPRPSETMHDGMGQPGRYFLIYRLLAERRYGPLDYVHLMLQGNAADRERIGLAARLGTSGFAADGSLYAGPPGDGPLEARWSELMDRMRTGSDPMVKGCAVSELALDALDRFVARLSAVGVEVVLLMAPMPGTIIDALETDGGYRYIEQLRTVLANRYPQRFYDAFDLRGIAPDSEFYDGMHGGEIAYTRAILAAARRLGSPLHGMVDENRLTERIALWAGTTQVGDDPIYQTLLRSLAKSRAQP
jgi:hypothetical protein